MPKIGFFFNITLATIQLQLCVYEQSWPKNGLKQANAAKMAVWVPYL